MHNFIASQYMLFILITTEIVVLLFIFRKLLINAKSKVLKSQEGLAIVLEMQQICMLVNDCIKIKLQLQILPETGRNFVLETNHVVTKKMIDNYKCGNKLKIKFVAGPKPFISEYNL
jgi:hypothetical protein